MNLIRLLLWPFRHAATTARAAEAVSPTETGAMTLEQYQALEPNMVVSEGGTSIVFATPNVATRFRVDTLRSKEPDTIAWIAGFHTDDVFVDIGANVGMYTIWAAKTRGIRVYAFEPESQNYALLCRNIVLNGLSGQVVAYCVAISDENAFSLLYLSEFQTGGSCHTFGEKLDHRLEHRESRFSQGCVSTTLDYLVEAGVLPVPNHIKVDVDGLEHKVIKGCEKILADHRLRSVLVEINTNLAVHRDIIAHMESLGFRYSDSQVAMALRSEGAFIGVGNHIFHR